METVNSKVDSNGASALEGDRWGRAVISPLPNFFVIIEEMPKANYLGEFELLVMLTVIRLGEEAYGVPISREIERQTGRDVAFGTVYATLERLQEKGFVCSALGDATPERGGRAKRYFRVTATGVRRVRETKQSLIRLWRGLRELEGGVG